MLNKIHSGLLFTGICLLLSLTACKKSSDSPVVFVVDKSITLDQTTTSAKDSLYVKRDASTVNLKVTATAKGTGKKMSRLYIFKRYIDNISTPGDYVSVDAGGFSKDGNNQYYFQIGTVSQDSSTNTVTLPLRTNDMNAAVDEFYFIYTDDNDFAGPGNTAGVVLGPAQFFMLYGKLAEYTGKRLYNYASTNTYHYPGLDVVNMSYKYNTDAAADIDIYENTDNDPLFKGKFKSLNGTSFVKAPAEFSYSNATDITVRKFFEAGTSFTETPDSIRIGDIYLMNLRGLPTSYAVMKILYVTPENGKTGSGYNEEFFIFNVKK